MTEVSFHRTIAEMAGGPFDGDVQEVAYFDGADGQKFGILILAPLVFGGRATRYRYAKGWPGSVVFEFDGYE